MSPSSHEVSRRRPVGAVRRCGYDGSRPPQVWSAAADAVSMASMASLAQPTVTRPVWESLPHDLADWMGMDEPMLAFALDLAG